MSDEATSGGKEQEEGRQAAESEAAASMQPEGQASGPDELDGADEQEQPVQPPPDPRELTIKMLEARLADNDRTLKDYIRAHKRAEGEFSAYKSRVERDRQQDADAARGKVVATMLEVADNLERSLEAARGGGSREALVEGVELVHRMFHQKLEELGLRRFDPTGETFDPESMEAVHVMPVDDPSKDNVVLTTFKAGYRIGDLELRPAVVQVGRKL